MSECKAYGCVCSLGPAKARCTSPISLSFFLPSPGLGIKKKKNNKPFCFFPFTLAFQKKLMKSFFSSFIPAIRRQRQPARRMRGGFQKSFCEAWKNGIDPLLLNSSFSPVSGVYEDKILSPPLPFSTTPYSRSLPVPRGDPLPPLLPFAFCPAHNSTRLISVCRLTGVDLRHAHVADRQPGLCALDG